MSVTIHCDNESVIKTTASMADSDTDCDIFLPIKYILQELKHCMVVEFLHVKGHQKLEETSS